MIYLTFTEYLSELGGKLDETAFLRNIDRASGIIDNATFNRIEKMKAVPRQAKALCRDLIEYLVESASSDARVSSISQSAGNVSESKSFAAKTKEETAAEINNMVFDYLGMVTDDNGTPVLYRGCSV
jgi:hypothetical protein